MASDDHTIEPGRLIPMHDHDASRVLPADADYIMDEPTENLMHNLTVALENGAISADMNCPYEDRSFTEQDAPDCRRFGGEDPRISEKCLAVEAFDGWGIDCLEVGDAVFHPTRYPIPVTYRWEGWGDDADFYVTPVPPTSADHFRAHEAPFRERVAEREAAFQRWADRVAPVVRDLLAGRSAPVARPLPDWSATDSAPHVEAANAAVRNLAEATALPRVVQDEIEAGPLGAVLDDVAHADEDPVEVLPGVSRIVMQYSDVTYEVEIRKVQR